MSELNRTLTSLVASSLVLAVGCAPDGGGSGSGSGSAPIPTYTVGGLVSGLNGTLRVTTLQGDVIDVPADGPFVFDRSFTTGESYDIEIPNQPSGQICKVSNGTGVVANYDVDDISIDCVNYFYAEIVDLTFPDQYFTDCITSVTALAGVTHVYDLTDLDVQSCDNASLIEDATGIEQLVALQTLDFSNTLLSSIDLSANTDLTRLDMSSNQLTNIDLRFNILLDSVELNNNQITTIDNLQYNTLLTSLEIIDNPLTVATQLYLDALTFSVDY